MLVSGVGLIAHHFHDVLPAIIDIFSDSMYLFFHQMVLEIVAT
jgi:hypothetical protein